MQILFGALVSILKDLCIGSNVVNKLDVPIACAGSGDIPVSTDVLVTPSDDLIDNITSTDHAGNA